MDDRFWRKYRDKGLVVVGVNPGGRGGIQGDDATDDMGGVQRFTEKLGVTFRVGLEQTGNYRRFTENFRGANPFPVDVILDRNGIVAYVAREYDPAAMEVVIQKLLSR